MPKANTTAAQAAQAAVAEEVAHADHVTADHVTTHVPAAVAAAMNGAPANSETHIGVRCNESSRGEKVLLMPPQRKRGGGGGGGRGGARDARVL